MWDSAGDELLHRAGHQDLAGSGRGGHAGSDVDGDSTDVLVQQLDLACMESDADGDPQAPNGVADPARAVDGSSGTIEGREDAVAHRLHQAPAEPLDLPANQLGE